MSKKVKSCSFIFMYFEELYDARREVQDTVVNNQLEVVVGDF